jgi:antitoxin component of MazEF toxin-antitoxin module
MTKKLVQIGNSAGLIIDKPILELLGITLDTELELSTDGKRLFIEPARGPGAAQRRGGRSQRKPRQPPELPGRPPELPQQPPRYGLPRKQPW